MKLKLYWVLLFSCILLGLHSCASSSSDSSDVEENMDTSPPTQEESDFVELNTPPTPSSLILETLEDDDTILKNLILNL